MAVGAATRIESLGCLALLCVSCAVSRLCTKVVSAVTVTNSTVVLHNMRTCYMVVGAHCTAQTAAACTCSYQLVVVRRGREACSIKVYSILRMATHNTRREQMPDLSCFMFRPSKATVQYSVHSRRTWHTCSWIGRDLPVLVNVISLG